MNSLTRSSVVFLAVLLIGRVLCPETSLATEPTSMTWTNLPDLPDEFGFGGPIVGVHEMKLLVAGGANFPDGPPWSVDGREPGSKVWHDKIFMLKPGADSWQVQGRLPRPLAYAAVISIHSGVVILGGETFGKRIDPIAGEWVEGNFPVADVTLLRWSSIDSVRPLIQTDYLPPLPKPSSYHAATYLDGVLYVAASHAANEQSDRLDTKSFWACRLPGKTGGGRIWTELPPWPGEARHKMVLVAQNGPDGSRCVYLIGGSTWVNGPDGEADLTQFEFFTDGYRFDPRDQQWTRIADLPEIPDSREIDLTGYAFDADANRWNHLPEGQASEPVDINRLFQGRRRPVAASTAIDVDDSEILVFSGSTGRYITMDTRDCPLFPRDVLRYDTLADQWSLAGQMPTGVVTTGITNWNGRVVIPSGEIRPGVRTPQVQAIAFTTGEESPSFGFMNWTVLVGYLGCMVAIGVYCSRREKSTENFFLAGRRIPWWAAGLSVFGTQLSAITFMAIPAIAFSEDWVRMIGNLMILPVIPLVIWLYLPFFRRLNISTAYEYLEMRFGVSVRVMASSLFIMMQLGRMGIVLFLPAIALSSVTGMDVYLCIALMGLLATAYTVLGGIEAVIWTDVVQVIVLLGGALLCVVLIAVDVGGFGPLVSIASENHKFHMIVNDWSPMSFGLWVMIVGGFFTNLVPYSTDQTVVQRYLTTRSEKKAAGSLWLNFAMTVPAALIFYGLGTALFAFYEVHTELAQPEKIDQIVPWFVVRELPAGFAGLVIAGVFAAAMSSLDSSMNSVATAYVTDFHRRFKPATSDSRCLRLAKCVTLIIGAAGTGIAMLMASIDIKSLFDMFNTILGLFGGSLAGVFLLAVATRRTSTVGAVVGLVAGVVATLLVAFQTDVTFYLYAAIGCLTCFGVGYLVSLVSGGMRRDLTGLTIHTREAK